MDISFKEALIDDNSYCDAQSIVFRNIHTSTNIQITVITAEITEQMRGYFKITNGVEPPHYMTRVAIAEKGDPNVGVIDLTNELHEKFGIITAVTSIAYDDETLEKAKQSFEVAKLEISNALAFMYMLETAMGHEWPYEAIEGVSNE